MLVVCVSVAGLGSASTSSGTKDDDQVVEELKEGINPEDDSSHFMAIIVESLSILGKVHEALVVSSFVCMFHGEGNAISILSITSIVHAVQLVVCVSTQ